MNHMKRRSFLKQTGVMVAALALPTRKSLGAEGQSGTRRDGIHSRAAEGEYTIPPELKNFWKKNSPLRLVNAEEIGFKPERWQGDTSRVIYHNGKYHCWMIDFSDGRSPGLSNDPKKDWSVYGELVRGHSTALYMISEDTYNWTAAGYVPLGRPGMYDDRDRLQVNVFHHEGKFYMFYEACTSNIAKYGQERAGIACLVAEDPAGPWEYVSDDLILKASNDGGKSFDSWIVTNPRHIHLNGKWYMYYKGLRGVGMGTQNGVAIASSITGPYIKYEGNPILNGHGHFCWRYKHGILMIPHYNGCIHWSEDGIHFAPITQNTENIFRFGSLYVPYDPLFGKPVTSENTTNFWGFDNPLVNRSLDVVRMEWGFGEGRRGNQAALSDGRALRRDKHDYAVCKDEGWPPIGCHGKSFREGRHLLYAAVLMTAGNQG